MTARPIRSGASGISTGEAGPGSSGSEGNSPAAGSGETAVGTVGGRDAPASRVATSSRRVMSLNLGTVRSLSACGPATVLKMCTYCASY